MHDEHFERRYFAIVFRLLGLSPIVRRNAAKGVSCGNKILSKTLDLAQDFPKEISFHFLWVKMLPKKSPRFSDGRNCALLAKSWPKNLK